VGSGDAERGRPQPFGVFPWGEPTRAWGETTRTRLTPWGEPTTQLVKN
jgi:hypothetical protein